LLRVSGSLAFLPCCIYCNRQEGFCQPQHRQKWTSKRLRIRSPVASATRRLPKLPACPSRRFGRRGWIPGRRAIGIHRQDGNWYLQSWQGSVARSSPHSHKNSQVYRGEAESMIAFSAFPKCYGDDKVGLSFRSRSSSDLDFLLSLCSRYRDT
jgi:hypothetical protein